MGQLEDYNAYQEIKAELRINETERFQDLQDLYTLIDKYLPTPPPPPTVLIKSNILGTSPALQPSGFIALEAGVSGGAPPITVSWNFGDGSSSIPSVTITTTHAFSKPGTYTIVCLVTDSLGQSGSEHLTIDVVAPPPPPAVFDQTKSPTGLKIVKNPDGTVTASVDPFPGASFYRASFVFAGKWETFTIDAPTKTYQPAKDGSYQYAFVAYYQPPSGGALQGSKGASGSFSYPNLIPPLPPVPPGPGPVPLPTPLPSMKPATKERLLLSTATQDKMRSAASQATQQWANFIVEANKWMDYPIYGNYQASQGVIGPNYALAGILHEDDYPALASDYKDKALAELEALLDDYQKGPNETCQKYCRGDGARTKFDVPGLDLIPASFKCYLADITTKTVTRGIPPYPWGNYDEVQYYSHFLKVWQGTLGFVEGIDWRRNDGFPNSAIEWGFTIGGYQPLPGSQYQVELCSVFGASPVACTVDPAAKTFTLPAAPRADQYIFVEYCYHSLVRRYRQTSENTGGFNSVFIDATYTSRSLGCNVALILDWCWDHPKFDAALKTRAMDMLVRWADWLKVNGYVMAQGKPGIPTLNPTPSNYTMGHYVSWALTAAALYGLRVPVRHSQAERILSEVEAWRRTYVMPALTGMSTSLKGGWWPEGDSYGSFARRNLLVAALALEQMGVDISAERAWASDVVRYLITSSPSGLSAGQPLQMMRNMVTLGEMLDAADGAPKIPTAAEMMAGAADDHWTPGNRRPPKADPYRAYVDRCSSMGVRPHPDAGMRRLRLSASSTYSPTTYAGGDWFAWPAPFPDKTLMALLATMADNADCRAYAQKLANDDTRLPASTDWPALVFNDSTRPVKGWQAEPLQHYAQGTGLLVMRDSWEVVA